MEKEESKLIDDTIKLLHQNSNVHPLDNKTPEELTALKIKQATTPPARLIENLKNLTSTLKRLYTQLSQLTNSPTTNPTGLVGIIDAEQLMRLAQTNTNANNGLNQPGANPELEKLVLENPTLLIPLDFEEANGMTLQANTHLPVWEQLPGETPLQFEMFTMFRDNTQIGEDGTMRLGRNLIGRTIYETFTPGQLQRLQTKYQQPMNLALVHLYKELFVWKERAQAMDVYHDTLREKVKQREIRLMEERHKKTSQDVFEKAADYFLELDSAYLNPKDALKWFEAAAKLERLSMGLSQEKANCEIKAMENSNNTQLTQIEIKNGALGGTTETKDKELGKIQDILSVLQRSGVLGQHQNPEVIEVVAEEVPETVKEEIKQEVKEEKQDVGATKQPRPKRVK